MAFVANETDCVTHRLFDFTISSQFIKASGLKASPNSKMHGWEHTFVVLVLPRSNAAKYRNVYLGLFMSTKWNPLHCNLFDLQAARLYPSLHGLRVQACPHDMIAFLSTRCVRSSPTLPAHHVVSLCSTRHDHSSYITLYLSGICLLRSGNQEHEGI